MACSYNPGPESALELLPSSALSSAQVFKAYPKIAALENRTFHLLFKPDILTCYEQRFQRTVSAQNDNVLLVPNRNVLLTQARWGVGNGPTPDDAERAAQRWIAPGYIDLQVNGFGGFDYNRPDLPYTDIASSIRSLYATGATRFFPAIITGSPSDMLRSLQNLAAAKRSLSEGIAIAGFHVEGPHISPDEGPVGAHPRHWVRPPDIDEFRRWQQAADNQIRMVTIAPEWPGGHTVYRDDCR